MPLPRLPAPPPAEQGRRAGERFLATRQGWSADRLAAALDYVTGPYREHGRHTEAAAQEMAAFTATVTAGIEAQRATERAQAAPTEAAPGKRGAQQKGTEAVSTNTAQAGPPSGPATERDKGAATARLIVLRQIEAGQSAEPDRRSLGRRSGRARPRNGHAGAAGVARRRPRRGRPAHPGLARHAARGGRAGPGRPR